ncbi:hypothetical protein CCP3SC5AM1_2700004 [Gammaproteobacteria bacterium]
MKAKHNNNDMKNVITTYILCFLRKKTKLELSSNIVFLRLNTKDAIKEIKFIFRKIRILHPISNI